MIRKRLPTFLSNQDGIAHVLLLLVILAVVSVVAAYLLISKGVIKNPAPGIIKAPGKEPTVSLQTQYQNPFDKNAQYVNPFSTYKNPFDTLKGLNK